ncbi:MAG: ABC transporter permease [Rhodospirillales bacterium]|nr:ABC transporter permease [Rhodospirillales bacterium]
MREQVEAVAPSRPSTIRRLSRHPSVLFGGVILLILLAIAIAAPFLGTVAPSAIDPSSRNKKPGVELSTRQADGTKVTRTAWMGTDSLGRDVYSRVLYGTRVSLAVGVAATIISVSIGLTIGLLAGYVRWLDGVVMRFMDGMMAIPGILLAIALVSLWGAGLSTVILAVAIPEIPRVVRLVRSLVLTIREEPYVEAAVALGTPMPLILLRHIMPNTFAPLIVQGTFICASAILVEALLSFLGIGIPPEIPTWGNIMAEGRALFRVFPHNILFPGIFLSLAVLAINVIGDGLRDTLDPRMSKRI